MQLPLFFPRKTDQRCAARNEHFFSKQYSLPKPANFWVQDEVVVLQFHSMMQMLCTCPYLICPGSQHTFCSRTDLWGHRSSPVPFNEKKILCATGARAWVTELCYHCSRYFENQPEVSTFFWFKEILTRILRVEGTHSMYYQISY